MTELLALSLILALISMTSFGVVDVIAFLLSRQVTHSKVPLWTTTLSVLFLSIGVFFVGFPAITIGYVMLLAFGAALGVVGILSFYKGLSKGKIAVVVPIANAWPVISVLIGIFLLGEKLMPFETLGIAMAILGTILVSFKFSDVMGLRFNKFAVGAEYAVVTMLGWGIFYTMIGIISVQIGGYWATLISQVFVAIGILFYLLLTKKDFSFPIQVTGKLLVFGVLLSTALLAYSVSSSLGYVSISATITGSSPIVTVLLGVFILREKIERSQVFGIAMIVAGIGLISIL